MAHYVGPQMTLGEFVARAVNNYQAREYHDKVHGPLGITSLLSTPHVLLLSDSHTTDLLWFACSFTHGSGIASVGIASGSCFHSCGPC
jgi:hypothetical protein